MSIDFLSRRTMRVFRCPIAPRDSREKQREFFPSRPSRRKPQGRRAWPTGWRCPASRNGARPCPALCSERVARLYQRRSRNRLGGWIGPLRLCCDVCAPLLLGRRRHRAEGRASKRRASLPGAGGEEGRARGRQRLRLARRDSMPRNPLFDDPIFRRFFGEGGDGSARRTAQSLGSGVIVDPSGLVVTNHHVIEGMTDVKVALADKREIRRPKSCCAIRAPISPSCASRAARTSRCWNSAIPTRSRSAISSLAIGDPFGVGQTVTQGIVSALARTQIGISDYGFFIQTDAAINPGNSGGALVDMDGRLIGINSAIFSQSGGSVGIGFAIPVNMVKSVVAAAKARRQGGAASLARRDAAEPLAGNRRFARPRASRPARWSPMSTRAGPAAEGGPEARRRHLPRSTARASTMPRASATGSASSRSAASATLTVLRDGKPRIVPLKLAAAPEVAAARCVKHPRAVALRRRAR